MKVRRSDIIPDVPVPIPPGLVIAWPKTRATIPSGYALCDGLWYDPRDLTVGQVGQAATDATHTVQTPNMIDKFLAGAGNLYAVGATGGQANMPQHSHTLASGAADGVGNHTHPMDARFASTTGSYPTSCSIGADAANPATLGAGAHGHTLSGNSGNAGTGATADDNTPPYYSAYWIQKL